MPKVRFNLKDKGGLILLIFRYRPGGLPLVYSFNRHCPPKYWDKKTMRAKSTNRFPEHAELNRYLSKLEAETMKVYDGMMADGVQPSKPPIKAHLDKVTFKKVDEKKTLLGFILEIVKEKEDNPAENNKETITNYKSLHKVLTKYNAKLDFDDIDFRFLSDFERWCYSQDYSRGSVRKFVALIKSTVNKARKYKLTDNIEVREKGFSIGKVEGNKMVLYLDELELIEKIEWDKVEMFNGITRQRLEKGADIMLAGAWSGVRHDDLKKIKKQNLKEHDGRQFLEIWTGKKDTFAIVPVFPPLKKVLDKHDFKLPYASRSELLRVGRAVLELAGVNATFGWRDTRGGGLNITMVRKFEKFSAHVLRRTFATNMHLLKVDKKQIMMMTGHKTETEFNGYINLGKWNTVERFGDLEKWKKRLGLVAYPPPPQNIDSVKI